MESLAAAAADWSRPTLFFSRAVAFDALNRPSAWVDLDGDVEALTEIVPGITRCVERVGFFVDRRRFDPSLEIGRFTSGASARDVEAVAGP